MRRNDIPTNISRRSVCLSLEGNWNFRHSKRIGFCFCICLRLWGFEPIARKRTQDKYKTKLYLSMRPNTSTNVCVLGVAWCVFVVGTSFIRCVSAEGNRRGNETTLQSDKKYRVILQDISRMQFSQTSSDSVSITVTAAASTDRSRLTIFPLYFSNDSLCCFK